MHARNCQTLEVSPAEPEEFPVYYLIDSDSVCKPFGAFSQAVAEGTGK